MRRRYIENKKGFTLIELLVVIAIIGILASVVLASLNCARKKGADAAVKGNLSGIRAAAELFYDGAGGGAYSGGIGLCADASVVAAENAARSAGGSGVAGAQGDTFCAAGATTYVVWTNYKNATGAFCVDSTGAAKDIPIQDSSTFGGVKCP